MVKVLVMGYSDIIEPVSAGEQNYFIRVDVKFFDTDRDVREVANLDVTISDADNPVQVENKIFDAIVARVTEFGSTLTKSDVFMIPFKRGA